jgi:hypothetical protein
LNELNYGRSEHSEEFLRDYQYSPITITFALLAQRLLSNPYLIAHNQLFKRGQLAQIFFPEFRKKNFVEFYKKSIEAAHITL